MIPLEQIEEQVNIFVLEEVFEIESQFLQDYLKYIQQIKTRLQDYQDSHHQETPVYSLTSFTKETPSKKLEKTLKSVLKLKIIVPVSPFRTPKSSLWPKSSPTPASRTLKTFSLSATPMKDGKN